MIQVKIHKWERLGLQRAAEEFDQKIYKGTRKARFMTNNGTMKGKIGELAVKKYYDHCEITYKKDERPLDGKGDDYDFLVNNWKIDVKTSTSYREPASTAEQLKHLKDKGIKLLISVYFNRHDFNNFIDGKGDLIAEIHGYCSPDDLGIAGSLTPDNRPLYICPVKKLRKFKIDGITI
jgi:hypothetical protein